MMGRLMARTPLFAALTFWLTLFGISLRPAQAESLDLLLPPPLPQVSRLPKVPNVGADTDGVNRPPSQQSAAALQQREQQARALLAKEPDHEKAILALADSLLIRKEKLQAIFLLEDKLAHYPHLSEVALTLAKLNLQENRTKIAAHRLEQAELADPNLPDLHFWWSNYHLRNEEPLAALRTLQAPHEYSSETMRSQGELVRGIALVQVGLPKDAYAQFAGLMHHPEKELAEEARKLLTELDESHGKDRFRAEANGIMRFDTNPALVPTTNILGGNQSVLRSWVAQVDGRASYDILRQGNTTITLGHSILAAEVFQESQFNQFDNAPFLTLSQRGIFYDWLPYQLGLQVDYDYLQVGGNGFLQRYGVAPSATLMHSDTLTTTWTTRFGEVDYLNRDALENTVLDADGDLYTAGVMLSRRFPETDVTWQLAYNVNRNISQGGNLDFLGHQFQTAVIWLPPKTDWTVNLIGSIDLRGYDEPDLFTARNRKDRELRLQAQVVKPLAPKWDLVLGVSFNRNDSTVSSSVFERETYELGLRFHTTPQSAP